MPSLLPPKRYDAKTRKSLNTALEGLFSHYGNLFGEIAAIFKISADPVELLQTTPGIKEVLVAGGHLKSGTLSEQDGEFLEAILKDLISVLALASSGDELAGKQIQAVEKLLAPTKYELPVTAIDELIEKHHTPPHLARGWAIRELMARLSSGVESSESGKNVLDGKVRLTSNRNRRKDLTYWPEYRKDRSAYEVAREHWPKRGAPTLKSLAIKVHLRQLWDEGFTTISEASLMEDLKRLAEWDKANPEKNKKTQGKAIYDASGASLYIPWQPYSEGWRQSGHYEHNRRRLNKQEVGEVKRRVKKGGGKKSEKLPPLIPRPNYPG